MKITDAGMYGDKLVVEFGANAETYDFATPQGINKFAELCRDVGIMNPTDTSQLIGKETKTNYQQETPHGV